MESVISIENLSVSYSGIDAVNDISLNITKGEFLGITGPNGGGKTTLLNAVLGLIPTANGKIKILDKNITVGRKDVGYVPQTALVDRSFPISVLEMVMTAFLSSGLHPFRRFKDSEKELVLEVLKKLGLDKHINKTVSALSGGEFQKLLIARALVSNPKILILDEPVSNIDITSRKDIYKILNQLNRECKTIIMVTHDLKDIDQFSRVLYINRTIVFDGFPSDFPFKGI